MTAVVERFSTGPVNTNAYILACSKSSEGVIIDPAPGSTKQLVQGSASIKIRAILITHSHWDHIADLKKVKDIFDVPVYIHSQDKQNIVNPGSDNVFTPLKIEGLTPEKYFEDNMTLAVGFLNLKIISTPGHSPGSVCIYLEKEKILFSGDTLFKGSIGVLSLPTSSPESMWESLKILERLPPETTVYPGHGPATTIGDENWLKDAKKLFG